MGPGLGSSLTSTASLHVTVQEASHTPHPITPHESSFRNLLPGGRSGHKRTSFGAPQAGPPTVTVSQRRHTLLTASQNLLLHGQQLGVHALLLPLHQLHVGQQLGNAVWRIFMSSLRRAPGSPGEQSLRWPGGQGRIRQKEGRGAAGVEGLRWGGRRGMGSRQEAGLAQLGQGRPASGQLLLPAAWAEIRDRGENGYSRWSLLRVLEELLLASAGSTGAGTRCRPSLA